MRSLSLVLRWCFISTIKVQVRIKVVTGTQGEVVAAEAKLKGVNWVVLDRKLKNEVKNCLEELSCNIVTMKGSQPKILRLNLECWSEPQTPFFSANSSPVRKVQQNRMKQTNSLPSRPEEDEGVIWLCISDSKLKVKSVRYCFKYTVLIIIGGIT